MILILITLVFVSLYFFGKRNHDYWKKKCVPFEEPVIFFGSNLIPFLEGISFTERFAKFYKQYPNERFVGFFRGNNPALLVRDPKLIKHILVTDFRYFHYRGLNTTRNAVEPLFKNLFAAEGDVWKLMRQKLTPAFTSGKLKAMFPLIVERAEVLINIADNLASVGDEIDIRDLMARYTTDFVGACGFGIDSDSLKDESSDFRQLGKRVVTITKRDHFISFLKRTAPETFKHLHFFAPEIERKTFSVVNQIMRQRNYVPSGRNDFVDMMLELKKQGKIVGESVEKRNPDGTSTIVELELDELLIAAQIFIFFVAGFETSSSASSYLLHLLAYHPNDQKICQEEVDRVLLKYEGKLCFDAVKEMKYLEMCLKESLRLLPSPGFIIRNTAENYTLPDTDVTIEKDTFIMIPTQGLHCDEQYFEAPEEFRPERFHPDNINKMIKNVYLPFGDGPRSCIGERMGIMQASAGVATILSKFTVSPSKNSVRKPKIDPASAMLTNILGGLPLTLIRRS